MSNDGFHWPFGLQGHGMHGYVLDEAELGKRVATCLDEEVAWWGIVPPAILDISYAQYCAEHPELAEGEGDEHLRDLSD